MPAMLARLILSIAAVLLAAALYLPVFLIIEEGGFVRDDTKALWASDVVCGAILVVT